MVRLETLFLGHIISNLEVDLTGHRIFWAAEPDRCIPWLSLGGKRMECIHGVDRNQSTKKKNIEKKNAEQVYDN